MSACDVAIIGAGPYGLAVAAHLRQIPGLSLRIFGEPLWFWKRMPAGMLLRSSWAASHIADPTSAFTLDAYKHISGNHLSAPVSLERFVDYGLWFQRSLVPDVERKKIRQVDPCEDAFQLTDEDGRAFKARHVVVAGGISSFAVRPSQFGELPPELVSHSSDHQSFARFSGKRVIVVGGGQSALESAALLHECGADVEVLARQSKIHWLGLKEKLQRLGPISRLLFASTDVGPVGVSRLVAVPRLFNKLPRDLQNDLRQLSIRPAGARWLPPRLKDVPIAVGKSILAASPFGDRLRLTLNDRTGRLADHLILATGYRVDVSKYDFLSPTTLQRLRITDGFPELDAGFESSLPGLHFVGAAAAWSFGPLMYFVSGTKYAARSLAHHFAKKEGV